MKGGKPGRIWTIQYVCDGRLIHQKVEQPRKEVFEVVIDDRMNDRGFIRSDEERFVESMYVQGIKNKFLGAIRVFIIESFDDSRPRSAFGVAKRAIHVDTEYK